MLRLTAVPCSPPPGQLSEGPVWDGRQRELLWVDIPRALIHRGALVPRPDDPALPDVSSYGTVALDRPVGAVVPCRSGALLAATGMSVLRLDGQWPPAAIATIGLPDEGTHPPRRMNDAKCDPRGRLLAGTKAYDDTPGAGSLYSLGPAGLVTLIESVTISNGLGWSPDGRLLYYADSPTGRVDVFDYDLDSGAIGGRRPFATLDGGVPDGLTVDAEGRVWVAVWGAGEVRAYTPDGAPYAVVDVATSHVTSCTFAGPELDVLVITTAAAEGLTDTQLRAEPDAGRLFVCRPGATGLPATPYDDSRAGAHPADARPTSP
ncbi:SMP-30/gluconolactonase/LRE family protein [Streptomyces sp. NPDC003042]